VAANRQTPSFAATMPPAARPKEGILFLRNPRAAPLYVVGFRWHASRSISSYAFISGANASSCSTLPCS